MAKDEKKHFIRIFALSLAVTLLLSPARPFSCSEEDSFITEVRAEEEPITDTQRGIALLMTIMLAQGLRFVGDWNTVVQPGLQKLWEDFSTATGNAVTLPMIVAGSSLVLGYIRTSNTVNNAIANFMAWYKQTFSQPTSGNVEIPVSVGGGSYVVPPVSNDWVYIVPNRTKWYVNGNYSLRTIILTTSTGNYNINNTRLYVFSDASIPNGVFNYGYSGTGFGLSLSSTLVDNGHTYYYSSTNLSNYVSNIMADFTSVYPEMIINVNNIYSYQTAFEYTYGSEAIADVSMEGQSLELKDGYQLESDQAKLYDIAGLEALVASLALTLENIDDLVRDIPLIFDTPWAEDFPDVPAYVDTPDDTIPWVDVPDSVIPADTPEYVPTIPSERDEYKVLGLDQVFPFSIPFDLYYLTQILVHEPETPSFTFAMVNPVNGQLITEELDLSDFDGIASIARTIETILFIAFLIFVTRGLIRS